MKFYVEVLIKCTALSKIYNNLLTIIIPRHVNRTNEIIDSKPFSSCEKYFNKEKIDKKTDIYLVDTYGETQSFFNICKTIFLGGSIVKHGGQNPLEPARFGCKIIHGPNIDNFKEVYELLKHKKISFQINSINQLYVEVKKLLKQKSNNVKKVLNLRRYGVKILNETLLEINKFGCSTMKLNKPKFWDYKKINFLSLFLLPFTIFLHLINFLKKIYKAPKIGKIKTLCIGNIYLGGTGKTPLAIEFFLLLKKLKYKPVFIKKYYKDQIDEQNLLKKYGKLLCEKKRIYALKKAVIEGKNVAILDDGLQDKNLSHDLSIVCFNVNNWIGNGQLLPAGALQHYL